MIQEQIQRLRESVTTCYNTISSKNGVIPEEVADFTVRNLPAAIESIPTSNCVLTELEVTANREYLPADYDADGFSKVTARFDTSSLPKVTVSSFRVTNDCINEYGRWEGENLIDTSKCETLTNAFFQNTKLKKIDISSWDTSKATSFSSFIDGNSSLEEVIGIEDIDLSSADSLYCFGRSCPFKLQKNLDLRRWNTQNITNMNRLFSQANLNSINMEGINTENVTDFGYFLGLTQGLRWLNLVGLSAKNATYDMNYCLWNLGYAVTDFSIVGDYNYDYVVTNDIKVFSDLHISYKIQGTDLGLPSLRALINGLADVNNQPEDSRPTLALGTTLLAKLTNEDRAIATEKGWNLA